MYSVSKILYSFNSVFSLGGQMGQSNKDTVYVLLWGIEHNRNCEDVLTIFLCVSGTI